jgi:hypothetical protein
VAPFTSRALLVSPAAAYGAVAIGLYVLRSGWAAILLYHLVLVAAVLLCGSRGDVLLGRGREQGTGASPGASISTWLGHDRSAGRALRGWRTSWALPLLVLSAASGPVLLALWPWIALDAPLPPVLERLGLSGVSFVGFAFYYSVVNPWIEEVYWRACYASVVRRPLVADVLFAGYHVMILVLVVQPYGAAAAAVVLVGASAAWRAIARARGGLLIPVVTHMAADASIIVLAAFVAWNR